MPDPIERLTSLFERFPGIGPRQAQRFVQFLLRSSPSMRREMAESVRDLSQSVHQCPECMRYHTGGKGVCTICTDSGRDASLLAIVASDADLFALERSRIFQGKYFVLGGLISLASEKTTNLHLSEIIKSIPARASQGLKEIILALPANPEGDATTTRTKEELLPHCAPLNVRISNLGRGLSTGSEVEYADPETLKNALDNRK